MARRAVYEAVGHGLGGLQSQDLCLRWIDRQTRSCEKCTVVDNGTMPWRRGSLNVDEGQPTGAVLIESEF
jgi:hypothetical protein